MKQCIVVLVSSMIFCVCFGDVGLLETTKWNHPLQLSLWRKRGEESVITMILLQLNYLVHSLDNCIDHTSTETHVLFWALCHQQNPSQKRIMKFSHTNGHGCRCIVQSSLQRYKFFFTQNRGFQNGGEECSPQIYWSLLTNNCCSVACRFRGCVCIIAAFPEHPAYYLYQDVRVYAWWGHRRTSE